MTRWWPGLVLFPWLPLLVWGCTAGDDAWLPGPQPLDLGGEVRDSASPEVLPGDAASLPDLRLAELGGALLPDQGDLPGADAAAARDLGPDLAAWFDLGLPDLGPPPPCQPGQPILVGAVRNARDLGGIALTPPDRVACGQLLRGSQLVNLSDAGCAEFTRRGIRTVLDLRSASEQSYSPTAPCVLARARVIGAPLPIPYSLSPADYLAILDTRASMARVFETLGQPAAYPVYFHCLYGRDRTGVVAAVILLALGASRDAIREDYRRTEAAGMVIAPDSLEAALDELERRGGVAAYLRDLGVTDDALAVLRSQGIERIR